MTQKKIKISIRNVKKTFGSKIVLNGVNLDLFSGESLVVIGGSGTGKSVLLKNILGLLEPDSGSIQIDGSEVVGVNSKEKEKTLSKIGMLFQNAALFDSLSVWENVAFPLVQGQKASREMAKIAAFEKLKAVGLSEEVAEMYPVEISGGMKKRVGLARAIVTDPEVLFFDEPTTGLDPIMGDIINDLIVSCVKTLGATALSITHDMASAFKISDRIAMLYQGKIIWVGETKDVRNTGNDYVEQFINGRANGPIKMEFRQI